MNFFVLIYFIFFGKIFSSDNTEKFLEAFDQANPDFSALLENAFSSHSWSEYETDEDDSAYVSDTNDEVIEETQSVASDITFEDVPNEFLAREDDPEACNIHGGMNCYDYAIEAAVALFYNIWRSNPLFSAAKSYLSQPFIISRKYVNHSYVFDPIINLFLSDCGFNYNSLAFMQFHHYVKTHEIPKTSPLFDSSTADPVEIWSEKRLVLIQIATGKIRRIIDNFPIDKMYDRISMYSDISKEFYEVFIENIKESVSEFLLDDRRFEKAFSDSLESVVKSSIIETASILGNNEDESLFELITEQVMKCFEPILDLVYNYNDPNDHLVPMDDSYPIFYD